MLKLSMILGVVAALANVAGGFVLVRARGIEKYLRYFVALGAAFLMSAALLEMMPESLRMSPRLAPILIMAGYCVVHLVEHTVNAHFHYGEETHHGEFVSARTGYSVLVGLSLHCLFDGVAIGAGFVISDWLGWLIFLAIFLHKARGVHHGQRDAGQRPQPRRRVQLYRCAGRIHGCGRAGHPTGSSLGALRPARFHRRGALRRRKRPGARG